MTPEQFDALFDQFSSSVFRLETLQQYAVGSEDQRLRAFRDGTPRPERSVRTDPWLARIAVTTAAGKRWTRVHVVEHPLSEYLRYELVGYVESQAAGDQILIADRSADQALDGLREDFWLFDADTDRPYAVLMRYAPDGAWLGADYTDDPDAITSLCSRRDTALTHAVPLNVYLAQLGHGERRQVA